MRQDKFALGLYLMLLPGPAMAQSTAPKVGDIVYAFTDERGRLVHTQRLSDIPPALRPYARRVDRPETPEYAREAPLLALWRWFADEPVPSAPEATAAVSAPISLYRYRNRAGRVVYTNLAASVPAEQQHGSTVALDHVSLNSQLGRELDRELKSQYDVLQAAPFCQNIRAGLEEPLWQRFWNEHRPLVVCGLAILAFLLITPWIVSRVGLAPWARTLGRAIPLLGFVGVSAMLLVKTGQSLSELRGRAAPCEAGAWARAGLGEHPLAQRQHLVRALQAETAVLEQIHAEGRL